MASKLEQAIYNPYICYLPIAIIALLISTVLFQITPTKCLFKFSTDDCFFYNLDLNLMYHPLNIINFIFVIYNILYLYYNVILNQNVVGRSVKKIYTKALKKYYINQRRKKLSVLLFCYFTALILSYLRFPITLAKIII